LIFEKKKTEKKRNVSHATRTQNPGLNETACILCLINVSVLVLFSAQAIPPSLFGFPNAVPTLQQGHLSTLLHPVGFLFSIRLAVLPPLPSQSLVSLSTPFNF
jgi:hypothetical protein